ncbi:hypothetical protein N7534_005700 [Penicillium rubens]|nr:hypothetical protein N7534_005700 [Penicillium rubens]
MHSDEATLLANLQAVVMYTIILLSPSAPTSEDSPTMNLFFEKSRSSYGTSSAVVFSSKGNERKQSPLGTSGELGLMPAPAPKALWQAQTEQEWNTKYVHWLSQWSGQIYRQAEFDHIQSGAVLSPRAEKWLGEADEFGFFMVSILNATDVESPGYKKL